MNRFRWVVCQIDYLCECAHDEERREALSKLPPDLPKSYRRLLERLNRCSAVVQTMVQKCLLFIAYSDPKLTIVQLLQAISTPDTVGAKLDERNTVTEREIMRRCSSLIRKNGQYFEFAHFSVQEFLEDKTALLQPFPQPSLEAYFISRENGERIMAAQCLRFLQLKNFDQCPESEQHAATLYSSRHADFPFYSKAAQMWLKLTDRIFKDDDEGDANILEIMKCLFHPSKTSNFIIWAQEILAIYFGLACTVTNNKDKVEKPFSLAWNTIIKGTFRPLHLAAALNIPELCDHLLKSDTALCTHSQLFRSFELAVISIIGLSLSKYPTFQPWHDWGLRASLRQTYLPSTSRRNSTINLLFREDRILLDYSPHLTGCSLFSTALILTTYFFDWTPAVILLLAGEIPGAADLDILERCLKDMVWEEMAEGWNQTIKQSTLELLTCLNDNINIESDWGYRMSSMVWYWALDRKVVSSERDAPWLDPRITMSQEALHAKARLAIQNSEYEVLKHCLADDRLDLGYEYEELDGKTLLHLAVAESETTIMEMLLDAGCDPYRKDEKGLYPLHEVNYLEGSWVAILELFSTKGITLLSTNAHGYTIWHIWTQVPGASIGFLEKLYSLDSEASETALKAKNLNGHTPLTLLFKQIVAGHFVDEYDGFYKFSSDDQFHRAEQVIQMSHKIKGFWESHPDIFGKAARTGSVELVQKLLEAGAPLDPGQTDSCTPVHQLGPRASVECLGLLLSLYPATTNQFHCGRLPLELYLQRALEEEIPPESATLEAFIKSTKLWSTIKSLSSIIELFKKCISWHETVSSSVLLKQGLDVHQRVDGVSSIEYVCSSPDARSLSCASEGRAFLSEFFNRSRKEELNQSAVAGPGKGFTLLYALLCNYRDCNCSGECSGGIPWLIRKLVSRGVSLNAHCKKASYETPLCYYLERGYFQYAELLLDLGADPTITASASSFDPAQFAVRDDNSAFLKKLLHHVNEHSIDMSWERSFSVWGLRKEHPSETDHLQRVNNLHLVSCVQSVECLELLLNENLIIDVNAQSAEGYTCLHFASLGTRGNGVAVMRILLSNGADVIAKGHDGNTPLHFAAWNGLTSATTFLLEHGAVESLNSYGKTPRCYALQQGHQSVVQRLDASRLSDASQYSLATMLQEYTQAKRDRILASLFEQAVIAGDLVKCKTLVSEGCPINVKIPAGRGISPLIAALLKGKDEICTWLLENGASVLQSTDWNNRSTIEIASTRPSSTSVLPRLLTRYILEGGDLVHGEDYPIHRAILAGNIQGLELLLKGIKEMGKTIAYVNNLTCITCDCVVVLTLFFWRAVGEVGFHSMESFQLF